MEWGTLMASFIGAFVGNIFLLGLAYVFLMPKLKKMVNPFSAFSENQGEQ